MISLPLLNVHSPRFSFAVTAERADAKQTDSLLLLLVEGKANCFQQAKNEFEFFPILTHGVMNYAEFPFPKTLVKECN